MTNVQTDRDRPREPATPMESLTEKVEMTLRPRRWLLGLLIAGAVCEITFFVLDYHVNYGHLTNIGAIRRLFNTAREDGLASWFAVVQTALIALNVWAIFLITLHTDASKWRRIGWLVLAIFITYLSADDGATIHERLGPTLKTWLSSPSKNAGAPTLGKEIVDLFPSYSWQVFILPFFAAMGLFMLVFLWRELGDWTGRFLVLAAIACLAVAVFLDFIEGLDRDHPFNLFRIFTERYDISEWTRSRFRQDPYDTLRHFQKSIEECLEMFGMTLLWVAFLRHTMKVGKDLHIRCEDAERPA